MSFHHERFAPAEGKVPLYEVQLLDLGEEVAILPEQDSRVVWAWLMASPEERAALLDLYSAFVHVMDPTVIYTVALPVKSFGTDPGTANAPTC